MKSWKEVISNKVYIVSEDGSKEVFTNRKWNKLVKQGLTHRNLNSDEDKGLSEVKDGSAFNFSIIQK